MHSQDIWAETKLVRGFEEEGYEYLKREVPEVQRLEGSELVEAINSVRVEAEDGIPGIIAKGTIYIEAIAPQLFPDAERVLLDRDVFSIEEIRLQFKYDATQGLEVKLAGMNMEISLTILKARKAVMGA